MPWPENFTISKVVVYCKEKSNVTKEQEQINVPMQNAQGFFSLKTLEKPRGGFTKYVTKKKKMKQDKRKSGIEIKITTYWCSCFI